MRAKKINEAIKHLKPFSEKEIFEKITPEERFYLALLKLLNKANNSGMSFDKIQEYIDQALNEVAWGEET